MGVSYIPPVGPQIGEALGQIVQGLNAVIDPNFQFKRRFEQELVSNPELAQQLADVEFNSPGVFSGSGLLTPSARQMLSGIQPSPTAQINRVLSENVRSAISPEVAREGLQRQVTGRSPEASAVGRAQAKSVTRYGDQAVARGGVEMAEDLINPVGSRIAGQLEIAKLRAQTATTPAERFQYQLRYLQALRASGLENEVVMFNMRSALSRDDAVRYLAQIRSEFSNAQAAARNYNVARDDAEREASRTRLQGSLANIDSYRQLLGAGPLGITANEQTSRTQRVTGGTFGRGNIQFQQGGQPVNFNMDLAVPQIDLSGFTPSFTNTESRTTGPSNANRGAASAQQVDNQARELNRTSDRQGMLRRMQQGGWSSEDISRVNRRARELRNQ